MKKIGMVMMLFMGMLLAITTTASARQRNLNDTVNPGMGGPMMSVAFGPFGRSDSEMGGGMGPGGQDKNAILELAGLDDIMDEYITDVQMIYLEAKQAKMELISERKDLRDDLEDLADDYADDPAGIGEEIISVIEEMVRLQAEIKKINDDAMEEIRALSEERDEAIEVALDDWISDLEADSDEMEELVELIQDL